MIGRLCRTAMAVLVAVAAAAPALAEEDDPAFISIAGGYFDWNRQKDPSAEFRLEYRHDEKYLWIFKPLAGVAATTDSAVFIFAGVGIDVYLGKRLVVTPSFAPGAYIKNDGYDLGHVVEFRSQLEIAYRFDDRSRLGVAVSHYSNASLGENNPGTESAMLYYSIPLGTIFQE